MTKTTGKVLPGQRRGLSLSREGRAQAERVATRLARVHGIAAVYTSPLERAQETAAPIAEALRLRPRLEPGMVEIDVGRWTGLSLARARKLTDWRRVQQQPSGFKFPGGESFLGMQARCVDAVARLVERHRGRTIIVVSHADPIKAVVAQALGLHLDLLQRIAISPASVTAIAYRTTSATVLAVNAPGDDLGALA
jgi:probable phosphoglycerate mutase